MNGVVGPDRRVKLFRRLDRSFIGITRMVVVDHIGLRCRLWPSLGLAYWLRQGIALRSFGSPRVNGVAVVVGPDAPDRRGERFHLDGRGSRFRRLSSKWRYNNNNNNNRPRLGIAWPICY